MLVWRDNRILTLALRDGAPTTGPISAMTMTSAGDYFTEVLDVGAYTEMVAFILTTSHGGTNPTLDVKMQVSPDKKTFIDYGDAFTQITTTDGLFLKKITANFGKYIRFRITIGGTASPNYKLTLSVACKG